MAENNENKSIYTFFISTVMFFITVLSVCGLSYLKGLDATSIIRNTVMGAMGIFVVLFLMAQAKDRALYDYDNRTHYGRFFMVYLICFALAAACAYLPAAGWPFLVIFVMLSLFSNTMIGVAAGTLLLLLSVMLSGSGMEIFMLYFVCGMAGACLFGGLDDSYRIGVPVTVSILLLFVGETACVVLYANETLKPELFLIPVINVIISIVLLLLILKLFSAMVIYRYRDKYMEINDPECVLLVELKNHSKEEYYQAVHTAYFCDRIARKLALDADAAKAGGYYHRIGLLKGSNSWEQVKEMADAHAFPPAARQVLQEYLDKDTPIRQKETAVLLLSDAIVSSMLFLFAREQGNLDYDQIIDTVFRKKLETPALQECRISMDEISRMKKIFKEEKLYYDFLR